jgi:hypothetical protein
MDHDTIALTKLKEEMRLRQRRLRSGAETCQRSDDTADKDDREQLVYRRTRQPGTFHPGPRLKGEMAARIGPLLSLAKRRIEML